MDFKDYASIKFMKAKPMTKEEYCAIRGWEVPADENPADEGYLVVYKDTAPNHPDYDGYISWSPKEVFERTSYENGSYPLGVAVEAVKRHSGTFKANHWNGKTLFCFLVKGETVKDGVYQNYTGKPLDVDDALYMHTAQETLIPWLASQSDILKNNWLVEFKEEDLDL